MLHNAPRGLGLIATTEKSDATRALQLYRPVPLVAFELIDAAGIKLYCQRENDDQPELLCNLQRASYKEQLAKIKSHNDLSLLVQKQDFLQVGKQLREMIDKILVDAEIPLENRFAMLQISYAEEIERLFCKTHIHRYVELAKEVGKKVSALLQGGEISISTLYYNVHHNSSPYTHVTNVAAYTVLLAKALKMASSEELDRIAVGCLLHEVGKLCLPRNLLAKKGRLSAHDHQDLERTPQLAYELLHEFEELDFGQLMMAYQQHERVDGTGYPVRYLSDDIHPWAKLLAVADVFDAMTNHQEYRSALSLREVLLHLAESANAHFDPKIVLCMISSFQSQ